jgi:hypothetical protein
MDYIEDYATNLYRETAISWTLHAMKIMMGYEDVRNEIIKEFYPCVQNIEFSRTFDGDPYSDSISKVSKYKEIEQYLISCINKKPYVIFTACNVKDADTDETHYQSFYMDNINHEIYVIDPAKPAKGYGIYYPEVALQVVKPFTESNGYTFRFMPVSCPAQITDEDVFCQSWTLYILMNILQNGIETPVTIPKKQNDKYNALLSFYKEIVTRIPTTIDDIRIIYREELLLEENMQVVLSDGTMEDWNALFEIDPYALLLQMTADDMA